MLASGSRRHGLGSKRSGAAECGVNLELTHQAAQLLRHFCQIVSCLLRFLCAGGSATRSFGNALDVVGDLSSSLGRVGYIARHLIGRGALFLYGGGDGSGNVVDLVDHAADRGNRIHRAFRVRLNGGYLSADVFGSLRGLLGQFLDFIGDYGKAFAGFPRAGCFYGGVESKQVGLLSDGR